MYTLYDIVSVNLFLPVCLSLLAVKEF